jgi:hypothetical protein
MSNGVIKIEAQGFDAARAALRGLADTKIKVAAAAALNDAAYLGAGATKKAMEKTFDSPTPWILGGVRYVKARKDHLIATIDFEQWGNKTNVTAAHVLAAEIKGGERKNKRHEVALEAARILPKGMQIAPGPAAEIDRHGNIKASQIVQIMAWFNSFGRHSGDNKNMTDKRRVALGRDKKRSGQKGFAYFVLHKQHGKLIPGIYQRYQFAMGSSVRPVMYFIRKVRYERKLDFYGIATREARVEFNRAFKRYLDQMLTERGL